MTLPTDWGWITNHAKASGKTTALIAATKSINGILVCNNQQQADQITREHGIQTMSMHTINNRGLRKPFLFEPEVVGYFCALYENHISAQTQELAKTENQLGRMTASRDTAVRALEDRLDCRGGPGTTKPACGACITCLHRVIEAQERAIEIARKQGECSLFCRMPPREIMRLSLEKQREWREARREQYPDGVPCDCWKANMNAALLPK